MCYIQTYTGKAFNLGVVTPDNIDIEDIAHSLSMQCRFTGHTSQFWSVAQHSVMVAQMCPVDYKFIGLMHDAAEAYIGDIATPISRMIGNEVKELKLKVEHAVAEHFGFQWPMPQEVKEADTRMLMTEKQWFMRENDLDWGIDAKPYPIMPATPLGPGDAKSLFLATYNSLKN